MDWESQKGCGVLLHITSLAGPHGIGDMGQAAYDFVDFLQETGQRYWQVLPLVPPGKAECPYDGVSAFAGNPLLLNPELIHERGWDFDPEP